MLQTPIRYFLLLVRGTREIHSLEILNFFRFSLHMEYTENRGKLFHTGKTRRILNFGEEAGVNIKN
jgi:hypothetical protein